MSRSTDSATRPVDNLPLPLREHLDTHLIPLDYLADLLGGVGDDRAAFMVQSVVDSLRYRVNEVLDSIEREIGVILVESSRQPGHEVRHVSLRLNKDNVVPLARTKGDSVSHVELKVVNGGAS